MKMTKYDRPIGVSLGTPKPETQRIDADVYGVINNPDYRADLKTDMAPREIAEKWGVMTTTVYHHKTRLRKRGDL